MQIQMELILSLFALLRNLFYKMELKYFRRSEFNCKCGCNTNYIDSDFLEMMDRARRIAGVPFKINSGYRCEKHPLSKKNPTSSHIRRCRI